jgi:hypothetical protein
MGNHGISCQRELGPGEIAMEHGTRCASTLIAALGFWLAACSLGTTSRQAATVALPPFPADDPAQWVCQDTPAPPTPAAIAAWCAEHPDRGRPAELGLAPATVTDLDAKNRYDMALRGFLRDYGYRKLGWIADRSWRLTGPMVGGIDNGASYGVHPAVRVWYSPEITDWLCEGRPDRPLPDNAMIVKEMHPIDAKLLGIDPNAECMTVNAKLADSIKPSSWTVMVRADTVAFDGWYWANPTASGDGNPPILTASAVTDPDFFGPDPQHPERNPLWYPTGDLFGAGGKLADAVTPYNLFGAYCLNCHASAASHATYASLDNVLTAGLQYRQFSSPATVAPKARAGAAHIDPDSDDSERAALNNAKPAGWRFSQPLPQPAPGFTEFFGDLGPTRFDEAFSYRLPAETFDHHLSRPQGPGQFLTSDQCIGCHNATVSNSSTPHMLITDPDSGNAVNVSPYAEWRASPMGLAGRDPIFFAQLQSETNHLPMHAECIETTCLHCHGVMGQRQLGIDTATPDAKCKDLFAIQPPPKIPFGEPFRLDMVTQYQADQPYAKYGNLARDGISCAVCHHVADTALGTEPSFTGNWVAGPGDAVYGPYEEVVAKPMEHALGITPQFGKQIQDSDLCGTCHNILLPVFDNDGKPHPTKAPDGSTVTATYEQTTHLEWTNSVFARGDTFRSCQDCHMPTHYKSVDLAGTRIANIESDALAPTTHRLPDADITLTPREHYARHALHGLNLFLNEMFQQFPLLLGVRQIDYMGATTTQPALITAAESMQRMAEQETADIAISALKVNADKGTVKATVQVVNKTGHYLPSGVGFRRLFIEFTVTDSDGALLWASGRSNDLGVILDGVSDTPLTTEQGVRQTAFQPHYQVITRGDQVQIYQELIKDSDGFLTTSFLRRVHPVKDNRLRAKGFDPKMFLDNPSPFIQILGELEGEAAKDPHYFDPALTGSDEIVYRIALPAGQARRVAQVRAVLYSQSIPASYLQQRFHDAGVGPAQRDQIRRFYYLTSHLNAGTGSRIEGWKLAVASAMAKP